MSIPELNNAQMQRRAQQDKDAEDKKKKKQEYNRAVVIVDFKIDNFIKILRREKEYKNRSNGGVFIDLGNQSNLETLPEVAADYLGRKEKRHPAEHLTVIAYKENAKHSLRVNASTNGTDRFIEVITDRPFLKSPAISVTFHQNNPLEAEPKTVQDAFNKEVISSDDQLTMGKKLVDFAINEAMRVMAPPQGH